MMTGAEYEKSLDDGRLTYFEGEQVTDIPNHPILGPPTRMVADRYDWLLTQSLDGTSPISGIPRSRQELRDKVELVHHAGMMAHVTYTSIMTLATVAGRIRETAPQYIERIDGFVEDAQRRDVRITQCITDAKGDRSRPPSRQDDPDAYVRVVDRTPEGVVLRGAKLHDIAGGAVVTAPSISDLENPEIGPLVRKYMSTRSDVDGEYRIRLFHAIRDLTADSYGGWTQVTNIQAGGGLYAQRIVTRKHDDLDRAKAAALAIAGLDG